MSARVLVVDDIPANVKLLEARLKAEYFEILSAYSGMEALEICANERVDVVLLDVMMPGLDGFEVCRRLKHGPETQHIPVVMVTALDQPSDKVQGLESGADDFLTKPVDDIALITRVKNLARLKTLNDEMMMRAATGRQLGVTENAALERALSGDFGRVMIVDDHARSAQKLRQNLEKYHDAVVEGDLNAAYQKLSTESFDLVLASLSMKEGDGLKLCTLLRENEATRHLPIIVLIDQGSDARLLRGLDTGVNDYLMRPIEAHELLARAKTQIKRKRHNDYLRDRLKQSAELAITDAVTGLYNRRYLDSHLTALIDDANAGGRALSVMLVDIDGFNAVNDSHGHRVGDTILVEFAKRLRRNVRGVNLACRLSSENFLVVLPDMALDRAGQIAERLRAQIAAEPFLCPNEDRVRLTSSVGIAELQGSQDGAESLMRRAGLALNEANQRGRNRIAVAAA
ncbi:MAG: PleD family two-component system response regulator [Alphaproteobacteria bacterium]|nr:PleD family two-component system response regulator [Alphaproteobacteria bacterium]